MLLQAFSLSVWQKSLLLQLKKWLIFYILDLKEELKNQQTPINIHHDLTLFYKLQLNNETKIEESTQKYDRENFLWLI